MRKQAGRVVALDNLDLNRETAQAICALQQTDVGILLSEYMTELIETRKNRLVSHRGFTSIPDMWHDQGFIEGVQNVGLLFLQAAAMIATEEVDEKIPIPEPSYLGASSEDPRR